MSDTSFVCNLHSHCSFTFYFFHISSFYNKIILAFLNVEAMYQLGRNFCSFSLSRPIYSDYLLFEFLYNICDELNKLYPI